MSEIQVYSNYFKVLIDTEIHKYNMKLNEGNVNDYLQEIKSKILRNRDNRMKINENLGKHFMFLNNSFYSTNIMKEELKFEIKEGVTLTLFHDKTTVGMDEVKPNIIGRLLKNLQRRMKLKLIGRKLFDNKKARNIEGFEIWPGYASSFVPGVKGNPNVLSVDLVHKVITNQNVLDKMN